MGNAKKFNMKEESTKRLYLKVVVLAIVFGLASGCNVGSCLGSLLGAIIAFVIVGFVLSFFLGSFGAIIAIIGFFAYMGDDDGFKRSGECGCGSSRGRRVEINQCPAERHVGITVREHIIHEP
ncbi:MAG: hypothetical protein COX80_00920 [Candidatus Magasanikbacteria bacterium CG_4_10_14_0_2_um_filter_33_14]|uniref:Uncharacterized protein n=1 Tax=Candidatus Magasanikbacteria bacterium CG_4_10_14_0_2_um_filter_33_14 TaxID=1974636 RepID=A0A2M7VBP3_9BACT|nr:MAG: hypothetical protein COX80_00920 [Candidatus Magasanikbacteria bacterium CG_4_10_14_0_2_um_filter_33_14]